MAGFDQPIRENKESTNQDDKDSDGIDEASTAGATGSPLDTHVNNPCYHKSKV